MSLNSKESLYNETQLANFDLEQENYKLHNLIKLLFLCYSPDRHHPEVLDCFTVAIWINMAYSTCKDYHKHFVMSSFIVYADQVY